VTSLREAFEDDEEDGSIDSDSRYIPEHTPSGKGHSDGPGFGFWRPTEYDTVSAESLHPTPAHMLFVWQTYQDNVDPFVKVLHTPTVTQVLQQCRCQLHELGPSMEALFMSIAYAAVVSLSEEEVGNPWAVISLVQLLTPTGAPQLSIRQSVHQDQISRRCRESAHASGSFEHV